MSKLGTVPGEPGSDTGFDLALDLPNEQATIAFGQHLGGCLRGGEVIYLEGSLGAGKTTLCRGVLRAFGHQGKVKSPTYTLVEPYVLPGFVLPESLLSESMLSETVQPEARLPETPLSETPLSESTVYHFDLYRLGHPEELEFIGIRDYFNEYSVALIEWPERGVGILPKADLKIEIILKGRGRNLCVAAVTERGKQVLERLENLERGGE